MLFRVHTGRGKRKTFSLYGSRQTEPVRTEAALTPLKNSLKGIVDSDSGSGSDADDVRRKSASRSDEQSAKKSRARILDSDSD